MILAISICALSAPIVIKGAAGNRRAQIEQIIGQIRSFLDENQNLMYQLLRAESAGHDAQVDSLAEQMDKLSSKKINLDRRLDNLEFEEGEFGLEYPVYIPNIRAQ